MNVENDSKWNKSGTTINRRYSKKKLLQNSKDNILRNLISANMKVSALLLKYKSTMRVFHGNLLKLAKIFSRIILGAASGKETEDENGAWRPLWFQVFTFSRTVIHKLWNSLLSPPILAYQSLSIWVMLSIFVNLRKGFYYQGFSGRNIWFIIGK